MSRDDRWRQVEEVCTAALECDAASRDAFLTHTCGADVTLRREVDTLLANAECADAFLAEPIGLFAAAILTEEPLSMVGEQIGQYRIVERLGAGGMGVVYRAEDTKLQRSAALKFLPPAFTRDEAAKTRFMREAQAASALEHINICTIYDIAETPDGQLFLAMAFYAGETLQQKIASGPVPLDDALNYAIQIAEGLSKAHAAGIVHLDVKPANVLVTDGGVVKIVDFGIARLLGEASASAAGSTFGTVAYMSPEQLAGAPIDARSDVWSLGVVLYELLAGVRPFNGGDSHIVEQAIDQANPEPLVQRRTGIPRTLGRIVDRALAKSPESRHQTADELAADLRRVRESIESSAGRTFRTVGRTAALVAAVLVLALLAGLWRRGARERWAHETAMVEIQRLVDAGQFSTAAPLIVEARAVLPQDPTLEKLWMQATEEVSIDSTPSGATVSLRPYQGNPDAWEAFGRTPLKKARVIKDVHVFRVAVPGYAPAFFLGGHVIQMQPGLRSNFVINLKLRRDESMPAGMVLVAGGNVGLEYPLERAPKAAIGDFLIDRHEVTNEEFKKFVDANGYQRREWWVQPFERNGRTIAFEDAIALFRDKTGRPGPATWEGGTYPKGFANHPVAGVSWYEAGAYAAYAGKTLPTAYHWMRASQAPGYAGAIAPTSNFTDAGTRAVGSTGTLSGFGTTDMAGNVKEWCVNEAEGGKRFILGGGFGDPAYKFDFTDTEDPWTRRDNFGFRCVHLDSPATGTASARIVVTTRDYLAERPVSDEVFTAFKGLYMYDKTELEAHVEERQDTGRWSRERVTFNAAYGNDRVIAHVFTPKNASPPYQAVIYFPGGFALLDEKLTPETIEEALGFVLNSGRALVVPIYKGTYERRDGMVPGDKPAVFRDHVLMFSKDLGRSIDYLQTRSDIDATKLAFLGFSFGAKLAPIFLAVEPRLKTAILSSGGFDLRYDLPEVAAFNFVTRVHVPVLMLNGRFDDNFPLATSQMPLFNLLGTPSRDKRHVIYDTVHGSLPHGAEVRETIDWLDKYLGPIRPLKVH